MAVKIIERNPDSEQVLREISNMNAINSINVVSLIDSAKTHNSMYIVMEYCNGGDLAEFVCHRGGYISESEAKVILR